MGLVKYAFVMCGVSLLVVLGLALSGPARTGDTAEAVEFCREYMLEKFREVDRLTFWRKSGALFGAVGNIWFSSDPTNDIAYAYPIADVANVLADGSHSQPIDWAGATLFAKSDNEYIATPLFMGADPTPPTIGNLVALVEYAGRLLQDTSDSHCSDFYMKEAGLDFSSNDECFVSKDFSVAFRYPQSFSDAQKYLVDADIWSEPAILPSVVALSESDASFSMESFTGIGSLAGSTMTVVESSVEAVSGMTTVSEWDANEYCNNVLANVRQ